MHRILLIFLCSIALGGSAAADALRLVAGDVLNGQLVQIQDQTLVFRTELAGQVIVPLEEVRAIDSSRSMIFELNDGRTVPATLAEEDGQHYLIEQGRDARMPIALADIRKTAALPYATTSSRDQPSLLNPEWAYSADVGVTAHAGTRDYVAPYAQIGLRREAEDFDFGSYLRLEMEDTADLPDHVRAALEWDLHRNRGWYPQVYARAERNVSEGRNFQGDLGAGIATRLYDGAAGRLTGSAGLGLAYEDLDISALRGSGLLDRLTQTEHHQTDLNLRVQLRYTGDLYAGALWEKRLELYPSLTDLGELRVRYETALWVPLTPRLKLKVDASVGYDNERHLRGLHEWESTVGASVSLDF